MEDERETSSLRRRLRKSSMNLSVCFHGRRFESFDSYSSDHKLSPMRSPSSVTPMRSPSSARSRSHELPEIKGKCMNLISRMGRHRRHSADFSYDPLSYALNFDEGASEDARFEELPIRNFSSRLPNSPHRVRAERLGGFAPPTPKAIPAVRSITPPPRAETLRNGSISTARAEIEAAVMPLRSREKETGRIATPTTAVMSRREIVTFS